jgi:hypothetical protein
MVFEEIQQRLDQDLEEYKDDEEREREEKKHHLYKLKQQLEQYLQELPVVGFNTGKYDVNAMKVDFLNTSKRTAFSLISVKCCKQDSTVSLVSPSVSKADGLDIGRNVGTYRHAE